MYKIYFWRHAWHLLSQPVKRQTCLIIMIKIAKLFTCVSDAINLPVFLEIETYCYSGALSGYKGKTNHNHNNFQLSHSIFPNLLAAVDASVISCACIEIAATRGRFQKDSSNVLVAVWRVELQTFSFKKSYLQRYLPSRRRPEWSLKSVLAADLPFTAYGHFARKPWGQQLGE